MNFVKLVKSAWVGVLRDDKHGTECQEIQDLVYHDKESGLY